MKYLISFIFVLFLTHTTTSQTYEVGLMAGGANYIGDVGSTYYLLPNDIMIGAIGKWNRSKRHAFRASIIYGELNGNDAKGDDRRKQRGYSFSNSVKEISAGMEFNFWDWYLYDGEPQFTPYLYTGFAAFNYNAKFLEDTNNTITTSSSQWNFAIPMVIGIKKTMGRHFVLGAESGARYTFTDNIDGSDPNGNFGGEAFGNIDNNDWYVFTGITLSYTWGRIPCYCAF